MSDPNPGGGSCRRLIFFICLVLLTGLTACRTTSGAGPEAPVAPAGGPVTILAGSITGDTTVSGQVTIAEDLLIPGGATLTVSAGARVTVIPSEATRTDAQFVTTGTEVVVRGRLIMETGSVIGTETGGRDSWGGIIITSPGGSADLEGAKVYGARYGILALAGRVRAAGCTFADNTVGIAGVPGAEVVTARNTYSGNAMATAAYHSEKPISSAGDVFGDNDDDAMGLDARTDPIAFRQLRPVLARRPAVTREYLGEVALTEDTVWSGTVIIDGQVAVMPEATLTIAPGTHVLFSFRDTNADGLGESWIIVQGTVRVNGEEDSWVLFDSDDPGGGPGSWDSLSIIASDSEDNRISYALFRHGVKSFHSHFSQARLDHVVFTDNLRGVQFQESTGMVIDNAYLTGNQSAMRFRDSTVTLSNVVAEDNVSGINFLRCEAEASDLVVTGSIAESLVARESRTRLRRVAVVNNVKGPRFKGDGEEVSLRQSVIAGNLTEGISFNNVTAEISESALTGNGFTGLSVTDAEVTAFANRISGNGRFAVDNNGETTVDARGNDWGDGDEPPPETIYDAMDEAGIGPVLSDRPRRLTVLLPGMEPLPGPLSGEVLIVGDVVTGSGDPITLEPGTSVFFAEIPEDSLFDLCSDHPSFPGSELHVTGELTAAGTADRPITFAPARRTLYELDPDSGPGRAQWGALNLMGGRGAVIDHAFFFRAATGIHAREAGRVTVSNSVFASNLVGLRFSSSRVEITGNTFELNTTGIRFHEFGGVVADNTLDANGTGIFVTGNPEKVTITGNRFVNQYDYNVKLGIHVTDDVMVEGGEFGVPAGRTAADMIFDREDDEYLGKVVVVPESASKP